MLLFLKIYKSFGKYLKAFENCSLIFEEVSLGLISNLALHYHNISSEDLKYLKNYHQCFENLLYIRKVFFQFFIFLCGFIFMLFM